MPRTTTESLQLGSAVRDFAPDARRRSRAGSVRLALPPEICHVDEVRGVDVVEWLSAASRATAQAEEICRTHVTPIPFFPTFRSMHKSPSKPTASPTVSYM